MLKTLCVPTVMVLMWMVMLRSNKTEMLYRQVLKFSITTLKGQILNYRSNDIFFEFFLTVSHFFCQVSTRVYSNSKSMLYYKKNLFMGYPATLFNR